jgi:hypothetical protein
METILPLCHIYIEKAVRLTCDGERVWKRVISVARICEIRGRAEVCRGTRGHPGAF